MNGKIQIQIYLQGQEKFTCIYPVKVRVWFVIFLKFLSNEGINLTLLGPKIARNFCYRSHNIGANFNVRTTIISKLIFEIFFLP